MTARNPIARRKPPRGRAKRKLIESMPDPMLMSEEDLLAEIDALMRADEKSALRWACDRRDCDGEPHEGWLHKHARASQQAPHWTWTTWLLMTGRGWGKTRTAAETVKEWAKKPDQFIAVVAKNETLVREICFESKKSGLLAVLDPDEVLSYSRSTGSVHIVMKNGTIIRGFGGEVPDNLRGWAFDKAWCDEYAAWNRITAQAVYDMLWFCLRESAEPQVIISTTPKPLPHVKKLVERNKAQVKRLLEQAEQYANGEIDDADLIPQGPRVVITHGHTNENLSNLSAEAYEELDENYTGLRLGAQELGGVLLEDIEGALWQQWMFEVEGFRIDTRADTPPIERLVIAVDVATTTSDTADETGICVAGRGYWRDVTYSDPRPRGYVFHSEAKKLTPYQTMQRVAQMYHEWGADVVVLEANNGGDYLSTVLQMVDPTVNFRVVHASRDKRTRATPVAGLYEQSRVHHVGEPRAFDALETTMTTYVGAPESEEKSPDILDAHVWAMTDLFLDPAVQAPRPKKDQRSKGRR